jgi:hypothetical protein
VQDLQHLRPDHDETLVARLFADDLAGREADAARALVAECPACAALLADLRALASATTALPATRRPRDFRLTQADAARLRPGGWRQFLRRFGDPDLSFTRPLAMGLTTLGIAGLLLTALPGGFGFGSGGASILSTVGNRVTLPEAGGGAYYGSPPAASGILGAAPSPAIGMAPNTAPSAVESSPASGPPSGDRSGFTKSSGTADQGAQALPESAAPAERATLGPAAIASPPDAGGGPSPLFVLSVVVLLAGLGLGGLRRAARRLA